MVAPRSCAYIMEWRSGPLPSAQEAAIRAAGLDPADEFSPVYRDRVRGRVADPATLVERRDMLAPVALHQGDTVLVYTLACLAVSVADMAAVARRLAEVGATVRELQTGREWLASDPVQVLDMTDTHRVQRAGGKISAARAKRQAMIDAGELVLGRPIVSTPDQVERAARLWLEPSGQSLRQIGTITGIHHQTLDRNMQGIFGCVRAVAQERVRAGTWAMDDQVALARQRAASAQTVRRTKSLSP